MQGIISAYRPFMETTLKEAGEALVSEFYKNSEVLYSKSESPADRVTKGDLNSHKIILQRLKEHYPHHLKIGEEGEKFPELDPGSEAWIFDPLDGSWNFSERCPRFATMMAFVRGYTVEAAAIYYPLSKQCYFAARGEGLFRDGKPVTARYGCDDWHRRGLCMGGKNYPLLLKLRRPLHPSVETQWNECIAHDVDTLIRGKVKGLVSFGACVWDYAPILRILEEAGLIVTNAEGNSFSLQDTSLIAAPHLSHRKILHLVQKFVVGNKVPRHGYTHSI